MTARALPAPLPPVRGSYRRDADLAKTTRFGAGGRARVLFRPADEDDLAAFMARRPSGEAGAVTVLGAGSNVLIRDGGLPGVTVRLGRAFAGISVVGEEVVAGAAALDAHVAAAAAAAGLTGLEFLAGVPGAMGGALRMNAGAYGRELADVLIAARAVAPDGRIHDLTPDQLGHGYRHCGLAAGWVFTACRLRAGKGDRAAIARALAGVRERRQRTQPVRARSGGSTFKNPPGAKAWRLIEKAGCRGLRRGAALVSECHCNFLVNTGGATAGELEALGEEVRRRVLEREGVALEWEIHRLGRHDSPGGNPGNPGGGR